MDFYKNYVLKTPVGIPSWPPPFVHHNHTILMQDPIKRNACFGIGRNKMICARIVCAENIKCNENERKTILNQRIADETNKNNGKCTGGPKSYSDLRTRTPHCDSVVIDLAAMEKTVYVMMNTFFRNIQGSRLKFIEIIQYYKFVDNIFEKSCSWEKLWMY